MEKHSAVRARYRPRVPQTAPLWCKPNMKVAVSCEARWFVTWCFPESCTGAHGETLTLYFLVHAIYGALQRRSLPTCYCLACSTVLGAALMLYSAWRRLRRESSLPLPRCGRALAVCTVEYGTVQYHDRHQLELCTRIFSSSVGLSRISTGEMSCRSYSTVLHTHKGNLLSLQLYCTASR